MKESLIEKTAYFTENSRQNFISAEKALRPELAGVKIFETPILSFASADDEMFRQLKNKEVIGPHFMLPKEWLAKAKTVISFFLPFTSAIRGSNTENMKWPSDGWMNGRIEGQVFVSSLAAFIKDELETNGWQTVTPAADPRFISASGTGKIFGDGLITFTSNWSERHVAFIGGLGTFGLSKGLITEKGIAGRLGSVITEMETEADTRKYHGLYEYCCMCGKCAENCPADAISGETGKDHTKCSQFLERVLERHRPYYGCGKCQVGVPCETKKTRQDLL